MSVPYDMTGENHLLQLEIKISRSVSQWAAIVQIASVSLAIVACIGLTYCIYDIFM